MSAWMNIHIFSSSLIITLCVSLSPHTVVSSGDTPSSGMALCVGSHCKSLWRLNNTFMLLMAGGTNAEISLLALLHSETFCPLMWFNSPQIYFTSLSLSLCRPYRVGLPLKYKIEMMCVSLSIKARAVIQCYLFALLDTVCAALSHMPPSPWGPPATHCHNPPAVYMGHITLWNPFVEQLELESLHGRERRERERESALSHTHTHLPSLKHTPPSPLCPDENSGSLVNFSLSDRTFSGCGRWQFDGQISVRGSFQVRSYATSAAMLDNELSNRLISIYIKTSLARWSLERDEATGSSVDFGERGLLF